MEIREFLLLVSIVTLLQILAFDFVIGKIFFTAFSLYFYFLPLRIRYFSPYSQHFSSWNLHHYMEHYINPTGPLTETTPPPPPRGPFFITRVGDEALVAVGQGCSLHHLNVSGCHQIGDAGIIAIARGCPQLRSLDISVLQVRSLSPSSVYDSVHACINLH